MNRTQTISLTALILVAACRATYAHPHAAVASAQEGASASAAAPANTVFGSGAHRYVYDPSRLVLPPEVKMRHGHGLCRDDQGRIYFTYEAESVTDATRCLVRFAPDGTGATLLGNDNALAQGAPHGLNIEKTKDGQQSLYHANNAATVHKTTLEGEVLWTQRWTAQMGNYKPTDVVVAPGSDRVIVADGYGSSMLHALKTKDGVYAGKSWGGLGKAHGELNCPHGIAFDPRRNLFLVSDRGNKRLEYFTTSGAYHSTVEVKEITAPCNADVLGDLVLVPDLNGPVVILDKNNQTLAVLEIGKQMGALGFKHPHDAIFLENGDIVVCTWNPGRLGYFKKLADTASR
jgi:hypothetical protein